MAPGATPCAAGFLGRTHPRSFSPQKQGASAAQTSSPRGAAVLSCGARSNCLLTYSVYWLRRRRELAKRAGGGSLSGWAAAGTGLAFACRWPVCRLAPLQGKPPTELSLPARGFRRD